MKETGQSALLQIIRPVDLCNCGINLFIKVLMLLALNGNFLTCSLFAQGLISGANIIVENETDLFVNGKLEVNESFVLEGTVHLTGDFLDNHGAISTHGRLRFHSKDLNQYLSGTAITLLNDLVIEEGAEVHISSQKQITVNGLLINNNSYNGLVLLSDDIGTASLLHYSSGVSGRVHHFFTPPANQLQIISSPMAKQKISPGFFNPGDRFFSWYEPAQIYVNYDYSFSYPTFADANQNKDYFLPASGYYVSYSNLDIEGNIKTFSGQINQGNVDFLLSRKAHDEDSFPGMNLMGNPYPSAIDWLADEGWYGKEYLEDGKMSVAWVWNNERQNFGAIHPASIIQYHNGISNIIPSKQGFFVHVASGNDGNTLSMDDRVRVHSQLEPLKGEELPGEVLRLKVECLESGYQDEIILEYGHQSLMAAKKLLSPNPESPQVYVCKDGKKYSLLLLPETKNDQKFFAEVRTPSSGLFSLEISGIDMDHMIEIVNNQTNQHLTVLRSDPYVFEGTDSSFLEIRISRIP